MADAIERTEAAPTRVQPWTERVKDGAARHKVLLFVAGLVLIAAVGGVNAATPTALPEHAAHKTILKLSWLLTPCLYAAAILASVLFVEPASGEKGTEHHSGRRALLFAFLTSAPAIYFFFEAVWMYGPGHGNDEDYKHAQELSSRVWAAVTLLLAFYWYRKAE